MVTIANWIQMFINQSNTSLDNYEIQSKINIIGSNNT